MLSKQKYKAKRTYYRKILAEADSKGDKTATWDIINKVFGKKRKRRLYPEKGPTGNKNKQTKRVGQKFVANNLNKHFVNVAKELAANLKKTSTNFSSYMGQKNRSSMYLKEITL